MRKWPPTACRPFAPYEQFLSIRRSTDRIVRFQTVSRQRFVSGPAVSSLRIRAIVLQTQRHPQAGVPEDWTFQGAIDPRTVRALGIEAASAGIDRTQRENREGWWQHARHSRAFILDAAMRCPQPRLAVVFGAGRAYDLPLAELARRFGRLVLVDIDAAALAATGSATVREAALRRKVEMLPMDLTGVYGQLVRRVEQALEEAPDAQAAARALIGLCGSYRLPGAPRYLDGDERADLLVSGMLLSQLGLPPKLFAAETFERRFGPVPAELEKEWEEAWNDLGFRIQRDHIRALTVNSSLALLSSDVVHRSTCLAPDGGERLRGSSWTVLASDTLEKLVPASARVVERREWSWPRIRPKPPLYDGVRTEVAAVLLRPA